MKTAIGTASPVERVLVPALLKILLHLKVTVVDSDAPFPALSELGFAPM